MRVLVCNRTFCHGSCDSGMSCPMPGEPYVNVVTLNLALAKAS